LNSLLENVTGEEDRGMEKRRKLNSIKIEEFCHGGTCCLHHRGWRISQTRENLKERISSAGSLLYLAYFSTQKMKVTRSSKMYGLSMNCMVLHPRRY
jgi:hypothetical protein